MSSDPSATVLDANVEFKRSPAGEWRAFSFPNGDFLLHVPSCHVLEVHPAVADQARGVGYDEAAQAELDRLSLSLPRPPKRTVQADIRAISLNLAQGCNLRCTYCFAGEGDYGSKGMMSLATASAAISLLSKDKPTFHVVFFGGEPMLNFAVIEQIVGWCEQQPPKFSFSITTNGTLLTAEKLAWFKAKGFSMNLSYDGKGLQAAQRLNKEKKSNSEALVGRKIQAFSDQLVELRDFLMRSTITKQQLPILEASLIDSLTSTNFRVMLAKHATDAATMAFSSADIEQIAAILGRVIDRYLEAGDYEQLLRIDNIRGPLRTIQHGKTGGIACGAGVNYLTVSVSGGFYLCHRFNEEEDERFGGIVEGLREDKLAEVVDFRNAKKGSCGTCWMREWCAGGCFHEHKVGTGDKFTIEPRFCQLQAHEYKQALRVYTILLEKAPHLVGR